MDEAELFLWRIERLQAAIDHLTEGNKTAFAKKFGYRDGAFIRQMLAGKRPISDKFIRRIEAQRGMDAWFNGATPVGPLQSQIREELSARDVPDHVLSSVLELLRGFPQKSQKVA
jgi:hypothetical protein